MTLGERLKLKRKENKMTQKEVAAHLKIDNTTVSKWESDTYEPDTENLEKIAKLYHTTIDYLVTGTEVEKADWDSKLPELTPKDERDIAKDLEKIINNLESKDGYSHFDGQTIEDLDEEDRELLIASLENSMRLAKRMAKQKFTPKKYRK